MLDAVDTITTVRLVNEAYGTSMRRHEVDALPLDEVAACIALRLYELKPAGKKPKGSREGQDKGADDASEN